MLGGGRRARRRAGAPEPAAGGARAPKPSRATREREHQRRLHRLLQRGYLRRPPSHSDHEVNHEVDPPARPRGCRRARARAARGARRGARPDAARGDERPAPEAEAAAGRRGRRRAPVRGRAALAGALARHAQRVGASARPDRHHPALAVARVPSGARQRARRTGRGCSRPSSAGPAATAPQIPVASAPLRQRRRAREAATPRARARGGPRGHRRPVAQPDRADDQRGRPTPARGAHAAGQRVRSFRRLDGRRAALVTAQRNFHRVETHAEARERASGGRAHVLVRDPRSPLSPVFGSVCSTSITCSPRGTADGASRG